MNIIALFFIKLKNTLKHKHNLILLTVLPALAAAGAWALLTFYLEGGASIPVGILDYDKTEFSKAAIARFSQKSTVGIREMDTEDFLYEQIMIAETSDSDSENTDDNAPATGAAFENIARLIQTGAFEAIIVINPGFSGKITESNPEDTFFVISYPSGVARGIVAELFAAQVSRLYFNSDSANRVVRDAITAARAARLPRLTEAEQKEIYDRAFAECDAYWEPEPLMTIDYERYEIKPGNATVVSGAVADGTTASAAARNRTAAVLPGAEGGWQDMRDMLNDLIARAIFAIFFTYAAFCVVNSTGVMLAERADGVLTRMQVQGFGSGAWIAISAAAPFLLYGVPCAALLAYLTKNSMSALFAFAALACVSTFGALAAYIIKKPGGYKVFTLICVILSSGVSLYYL